MKSIDYKSTGILIDEIITAKLKIKYMGVRPEFKYRYELLFDSISSRLLGLPKDFNGQEFTKLETELGAVLEKCWLEQDNIMNNDLNNDAGIINIAYAAVNAQKLNAERNKLIRKIDELLGESGFTQLEKNYA